MYFTVRIKIWKVNFGAKSEARYKFVSVIIKDNVTYLVNCFLVLTFFGRSVVMERSWSILYPIARGEINADDHRHLHTRTQIICKLVFYRLFKVLECY